MENMMRAIYAIEPVDTTAMAEAQRRLDSLTKPPGSLGRLEELAKHVVGITRRARPVLQRKVIYTLAADHGVAAEGISAYPQAVTEQMVYNFLRGGAAINVLGRHVDARIVVADFGVAADLKSDPRLVTRKMGPGTRNMARETAMTREDAIRAVEAGIALVQDADLVGTGDMGIANTTASSAIAAVLTEKSVEEVTGRGTGIEEPTLRRKVRVIEEAIRRHRPNRADGLDVLSKVGGFEIAGLAGVILSAAAQRIPVVIDGFISGAAALIAVTLAPRAKDYLIAAHRSAERGHAACLACLGLKPLIELDLRLGEGTGAALAMHLVEGACKILNEMATFEEAGVSGKK